MDIEDLFVMCPHPSPGARALAAWNELNVGESTANVKVGLFGYDITCLANYCATQMDEDYYCPLIAAMGLDGLSIGIHTEWPSTDDLRIYCTGFHKEDSSDHAACAGYGDGMFSQNRTSKQNYTVTEEYFTRFEDGGWLYNFYENNYYGMSYFVFYATFKEWYINPEVMIAD